MRRIFIVVPAVIPTGPIKGAVALANALASERLVTLVSLKAGSGADAPLDSRVHEVSLAAVRGFRKKVEAYRGLLREAGGRESVASISMCLSADAANLFCRREAVTCASVRANLLENYRMDYGVPGVPVAIGHLVALRSMDHVVAMTMAMARQIARFAGIAPKVIGNFVDEAALEEYRGIAPTDDSRRFIFLGSLTKRKQPLATVHAIGNLCQRGFQATLDIVGDGPLREQIRLQVLRLGLENRVVFHGFQTNPYPLVARADAMVLPSLSEGSSRACLEALHLGVPCVVRAADGNSELVHDGTSGSLFRTDQELPEAMLDAVRLSRRAAGVRRSLLPSAFRQHTASQAYLELVESVA